MKTEKFGSIEFFDNYLRTQIVKEGRTTQEVIHRVHFAMSSIILETHKGKEAFNMLRNLTEACEKLSNWTVKA
ncbi:hypothetical protein ABES03_15410 [Neobacillus rhizosphaerae]|uniref:hypothetical protein n=1 Tax=Neobacillus rhizosphaerae TaxID=2880965 RepID=UPI003D2769EB